MSEHDPNKHLSYDDLLRTMTDVSDLAPEQRLHLESCPRCQRQADDMAYRYRRLGRMAKSMAPEPSRSFRVPTHQAPLYRWHFKPGVALGVLGVLIFAFTMWWPKPVDHSDAPISMAEWTYEEDSRLMAEVNALVSDALPEAYQQVAVVSDPILSKDLIDWIVPSIDENDENIEPRA